MCGRSCHGPHSSSDLKSNRTVLVSVAAASRSPPNIAIASPPAAPGGPARTSASSRPTTVGGPSFPPSLAGAVPTATPLVSPTLWAGLTVTVLTISDRCSRKERPDLSGPALIQFAKSLGATIYHGPNLPELDAPAVLPDEMAKIQEHVRYLLLHSPHQTGAVWTRGGTRLTQRTVYKHCTIAARVYSQSQCLFWKCCNGSLMDHRHATLDVFFMMREDHDLLLQSRRSRSFPQTDLILTTGGTGFAPRDITPEAISPFFTRHAPNISQLLLRGGEQHVGELSYMSRAVAGMIGRTLVVTLPGSPEGAMQGARTVARVVGEACRMQK